MNDTSVAGTKPLSRFLKMAVMAGVESAVQIHIDRGDDLNARDSAGMTPLMLSAAKNKPAICKLLLDAGADDGLLDPSGKTALALAVASGAHEAAAVLALSKVQIRTPDNVARCMLPLSDRPSGSLNAQTSEYLQNLNGEIEYETHIESIITHVAEEAIEASDFDLWEPEEDSPPPEADALVAQTASAIQSIITKYEPIDSSADWEDIDAYLPERSLPLARTDDAEARERLRLLMLRAVREGSVPRMWIEAMSVNDDQSANAEAETLLSMVINDLGAEVDERFEYSNGVENFEVFVKPEETPEEEEIVTDSLAFIDSLASHHTEPLRIYQKEFQRQKLISAEYEVFLSQAMESALEKALDALAVWPRGIHLTLAAGQLVKAGAKPLTWLFLTPTEAQSEGEPLLEGESDSDALVPEQLNGEIESDDNSQFDHYPQLGEHASDFLDALNHLASLPLSSIQEGPDWRAVRETLSSLRLNRRFLLELAYVEDRENLDSAAQYVNAMKAYQSARERMTVANLKLVFHLAKKYLYSGEPLDDLAQEGNIGLMKAVERFDWRRGFKFSTYAIWWIRQQIGRYVADKCRTIRVPVHVHEKAQRLFRETRAFESETGRLPELNEIAARLEMSARTVSALQRLAPEPLAIHDISIDEQIAVDVRTDFVSPDPFDVVSKFELRRTIDKVLSTLKPQEEKVLRLRYGIDVNDSLTLDDIGQRYDVTRERIRQIEAKALRRLRMPGKIDALSCAFFGGPFYKEEKEEEDSVEIKDTEQSPTIDPIQQSVAIKTTPTNLKISRPGKSLSINRLLAQAADLGVTIVDDRKEASGRIWVNLIDAYDSRYRRLARKLLALGFEFWPGKGYWR